MTTPQPGWYADPATRPEPHSGTDLRWWDGGRWTDAVVRDGVQAALPLPDPRRPAAAAVRVAEPSPVAGVGPGGLLTAPVLLVGPAGPGGHAVSDGAGRPLGTVVVPGSGPAARPVQGSGELLAVGGPDPDRAATGRWTAALGPLRGRLRGEAEVRDATGVPQLLLVRPARVRTAQVVVTRPGAGEVGRLVQQRDAGGGLRFGLHSGGRRVGGLDVPDSRGADGRVVDGEGAEVARLRRTAAGVALVRTADPAGALRPRPLPEPLAPLVLAGAVAVAALLPAGDPPGGGTAPGLPGAPAAGR